MKRFALVAAALLAAPANGAGQTASSAPPYTRCVLANLGDSDHCALEVWDRDNSETITCAELAQDISIANVVSANHPAYEFMEAGFECHPPPLAPGTSAALWVYVYRADPGSLDPFRVVVNPANDYEAYDLTVNVTYGSASRASEHVNSDPLYSDDGRTELASVTVLDGPKPPLLEVTAVRSAGLRCLPVDPPPEGHLAFACNQR